MKIVGGVVRYNSKVDSANLPLTESSSRCGGWRPLFFFASCSSLHPAAATATTTINTDAAALLTRATTSTAY